MLATISDVSVFEHQNLVSVRDCRQAVGDANGGTTDSSRFQRLEDRLEKGGKKFIVLYLSVPSSI